MKILSNNTIGSCLIVFIAMLFAVSGCKDDPTSPEEKEVDKPKTTVTIGVGGGTVGTDDVSIKIPAGAFNADHEIAIFEVANVGTFGENSVSKPYKISGLPNNYTKPIKIKMKYNGELEGESYIAVGRMSSSISTFDSSIVYGLQEVLDSSGYLISELPADGSSHLGKHESTSDENYDKYLEAITKYTVTSTQHFWIDYPIFLNPAIENVKRIIEEALVVINNDLGVSNLPSDIERRIFIGIRAEIVSWDLDYLFSNQQQFNMSAYAVSDHNFSDIKIQFGKALFGYELNEGWFGEWLYNAVSKYLEGLLTNDPYFKYPLGFEQYHMAPFNGLQISTEDDPFEAINKHAEHGIGMSSVIKYLTDSPSFGNSGIGKMYKYIYENTDLNPTTVLLNTVDVPVREWLPDFFKEYISGNIYNQTIDKFLSNTKGSWDINNAEDTLNVFSSSNFLIKNYQDLSAKMFKVNLNYAPPDTSYKMVFSMSLASADLDGLSMVMFGIKNGEAEYLETADAQDFEIPSLKSYYDDGMKQFLVVLVNSKITSNNYLGESSIDLTVRVKKQLYFKKCEVSMKVLTDLNNESMDLDGNWSTTTTKTSYRVASLFDAVGSFSGNTFTGSYYHSGASDGSVYAGTISVTLNGSASMVTDVYWTGTINWPNGSKVVQGFSGTGTQIPYTPNSDDNISLYQLYGFTGANVCEGFNDVNYHREVYSAGELLYKEWIDGYSSDTQSEIIIKLKRE